MFSLLFYQYQQEDLLLFQSLIQLLNFLFLPPLHSLIFLLILLFFHPVLFLVLILSFIFCISFVYASDVTMDLPNNDTSSGTTNEEILNNETSNYPQNL